MNYFTFKGINSKNIKGLIVQELPQIVKPKKRFAKTEIEGLDGDILEELGYEAYDKPIKIGITKECDIDRLIYWLDGSGQLILSNEPTKYYNAEIVDSIDFERLLRYKIATIKFHVQPYKYLINEEKKIIEPEETEENEEITIENSCKANMKLKVSGNSWQATRSGKNKFDISKATKASGPCSFKNNGDSIDITATYIGGYISANIDITDLFKEGETIYAKANFVASSSNTGAYRIQWGEDTGLAKGDIVLKSSTSDSVESGVLPTKPEGATKLLLYLYGNVEGTVAIGDTVTYSKIMLSNQPITDYEEYGAMPSPEFPSRVRNCGDNVNLLDLSTEILFYGNLNSDNKSITCNINNNYYSLIRTAALNEYLMKHRGETITFSTGTPIKGKTTSIVILGNMTTGANYYEINEENTGKCSITIPKEFSNITNLELRFNRQMTPFTDTTTQIKYLKLEKGSKATPYSPYNCGNVNLKVQNKNFLNVPQNYVLTGNEIINLNLEAGNYIINWEDIVTQGTSTNMLMMFYYEDETEYARYISPTYVSKSLPLNIIKNVTKVRIYSQDGYNSSQNVTTTFKNLMISKNGGDYVPHEEQTVTFPLAEGQKLMLGDYLADDGIHHKRKTKIFDGTEFWSKDPNVNLDVDYFYTKAVPITTSNINNVYVSHFIKGNAEKEGFWATTVFCITISKEFTGIVAEDTSEKRTSKFKAWLAEQYANGTPITVEYDLAEEEIETYTEAQQVAYNKIKELYSYEDETNISSDNEIKPKIVTSYFSKDDIVLKNEGYMESKPIINVYGTGDIEISLNNNKVFSIDMQNDEFITIDAMKEDAYKGIILKNRQMNGKFDNIKLQPGENIISWTGDLSKIEVEPKSRWL